MWQFLLIGFAWRGRARSVATRSWKFALTAALNISVFAVAGIFSSRVASTNSDVLLVEGRCGSFLRPDGPNPGLPNNTVDPTTRTDYNSYNKGMMLKSSHYASNCYGSSANLGSCVPFGRKWINWTTSTSDSCPFEPDICRNRTSVRFDTGVIDSALHLGINTKKEDRVGYRRVMECAPLGTDGFMSRWLNGSSPELAALGWEGPPGIDYLFFSYGPSLIFSLFQTSAAGTNLTYIFSNSSISQDMSASAGNAERDSYSLDSEISFLHSSTAGTFIAIPQLNRTDADVSLYFLESMTRFIEPVDDPWFLSQDLFQGDAPYFVRNFPVAVVGCTEQHQTCNIPTGACTTLTGAVVGAVSPNDTVLGIKFGSRQHSVWRRMTAMQSTLVRLVPNLGGSTLLAQQYVWQTVSARVPDNQWMLEFGNWFGISMTLIQRQIVEYITGPFDPQYNKYITPPSKTDRWMCTNQIVQRDDYASFSVLGIAIILSFGGLIILANLMLDNIVTLFQTSSGTTRNTPLEWKFTSTLQLQRMAYEGRGLGTWSIITATVPVTEKEEKFGIPEMAIPQSKSSRMILAWRLSIFSKRKPEVTIEDGGAVGTPVRDGHTSKDDSDK